MNKIAAVIFDLDGLMVDTERTSRQAWEIVLKDFGRTLNEGTYRRIIGRRSDESATILKESLNLQTDAQQLLDLKKKLFDTLVASHGVPVMPGLMELVKALSDRKIPWGVATSSPRAYAENILLQIGLLKKCAALATGDEVSRGKPDPAIYLLAAGRLNVQPQECMALEDSLPGCRAAEAAGMMTVAVPNSYINKDALTFVDYTFDSLKDVADNLDRLAANRE